MKNLYLSTMKNPSLLIISFLFFSVSLIAQESSESNAINEKVLWANEPFGQYDMTKEDLSKRSINAKHFINSDGSYTVHAATGNIHYEENGVVPNNYM